MSRAAPLLVSLTVAVALAGTAAAQPAPSVEARAAALVDEANRHYNVAEYAEAIAAYKEAYKLIPEPLLLWNLAQAYRLAGDCANALTFYKNYVREAPGGQFRAMADQRIPEMEACARTQAPVEPPPGGDGGRLDPEVPVAGEPETATNTIAPGMSGPDTGVPPGGSGARDDHPPGGGRLRLAGYALTGAGLLGVAAGGYFSLKARGLAGDAEDECAVSCAGTRLDELNAQGEAADRNATIAYVAGGIALAAGITTIVISRSRDDRRARVTLVPTPGGAAAAAAWSF